jgi:HAMP domain-containing protein
VTPVVVLAFAFVVMALGAALVAGLQLRQAVSRLSRSARADVDRLRSLADELQQGTVVTTAEVETLTKSLGRLTASRQGQSRGSR